MPEFETLRYEARDGVAWVTLDRPDVLNAFNLKMQHELRALWRGVRVDEDVRCVVLTGAGDKAFCVGIDRQETMGNWTGPRMSGAEAPRPVSCPEARGTSTTRARTSARSPTTSGSRSSRR